MDFGIVGLVNLASSSNTSSSNNGSFSNKQKWDGSGTFLKQEIRTINEDDVRDFKMAKMLSFSSPNSQAVTFPPYYYQTSNAFTRNAAGIMSSVRGPFTPSQWMELEHQALIYKYITANVPIPSYLLNPIRKAFDSAHFSTLRSNPSGWGGFHLGYPNTDPEPGRCRRTDGKKWRCSRDAVADQKYCEKHINRGRHRSRKPVEGPLDHSASRATNANPQPTPPSMPAMSLVPGGSNNHLAGTPDTKRSFIDHHDSYEESSRSEFGLVNSDSLVNPLNTTSLLRQFMDEWPKSQPSPTKEKLATSPLRLSRELAMGLGVGTIDSEKNQKQRAKWVPISWEQSMGGPLGEVLHNTSNNTSECNNVKALNFIERWDNGPRLASSPTEVLQRGAFGSRSNSSAGSSPRGECSKILDGINICTGLVSPTIGSFSKF